MDDTYENGAVCTIQAGNKAKAAEYYSWRSAIVRAAVSWLLEAAGLALSMNNTGKAAGYLQRLQQGQSKYAKASGCTSNWLKTQGELADCINLKTTL